jgi:hypothetical protein
VDSIQNISTVKDYPDVIVPTPPEGLPPRGTLTVEGGVDQEIASDGQYDQIYVTSNRTLTIDLQGGTRRIRVSELHLGAGHIVLKNVGESAKLELYVEDSFTATGNSSINVEGSESGDHSNLTLVYTGTTPFGGQGASAFHQYRFSGNLIVEQAEVRVGAGSSFAGNILRRLAGIGHHPLASLLRVRRSWIQKRACAAKDGGCGDTSYGISLSVLCTTSCCGTRILVCSCYDQRCRRSQHQRCRQEKCPHPQL